MSSCSVENVEITFYKKTLQDIKKMHYRAVTISDRMPSQDESLTDPCDIEKYIIITNMIYTYLPTIQGFPGLSRD